MVEAQTQPGGLSPGLASRLRLADGRRFFVKAVSEEANPDSPNIHRREAEIMAVLPPPVPAPRLLWTYDDGGWVALCFDDVDGRHPQEPWTGSDLARVVEALKAMAVALTPSPIALEYTASQAFTRGINGWRAARERKEDRLDDWCSSHLDRLVELEALAPEAAAGMSLVHFDLRADNLLIAGDRVYVVDWPWARIGASFVDWVAMAPSVTMQGGPAPEDFFRRFDVDDVAAARVDAVLCSFAGFFVVRGLEPDPPGLPTLRAFQRAQGVVAVKWLRDRLAW